jgi:hypothetical protein
VAFDMKDKLRFALVFSLACLAGVFLHEIGHAVAGLAQAIPVVPTPAKEYALRAQVEWRQEIWISLGGVAATTLLTLGTLFWYVRASAVRLRADAVLAGVLVPSFFYSLRFLMLGRGHDGLEWQAAQTALGVDPAGHFVDTLFLCLFLAGLGTWLIRSRRQLRPGSIGNIFALVVGGIVLVVLIQVGNNALFDRCFPDSTTVHVPPDLGTR